MLIPDSRICKALDTISVIFHAIKIHRRAPARKLASKVGQIVSMSLVLGHLSQIMTIYISFDNMSATHCDAYVPVSDDSIEQLRFWQSYFTLGNIVDLNRLSGQGWYFLMQVTVNTQDMRSTLSMVYPMVSGKMLKQLSR